LIVSRFRAEFLGETPQQVHEVIDLYKRALRGEIRDTQVWEILKATNLPDPTRG
jgi:putative protease